MAKETSTSEKLPTCSQEVQFLTKFVVRARHMGYDTPIDTELIYAVSNFLGISFDEANSIVTQELFRSTGGLR